jgi:hypothetical protein
MLTFRRLAPHDGLPEDDCVVIEFACGHYFINGYVRTTTGGYFAAYSPEPYETVDVAVEAASKWAAHQHLTEILTRGCDLTGFGTSRGLPRTPARQAGLP